METGEVFKYYRENKGFSINEVSEDIVSPQFLRKFENGRSNISYINLLLLLKRIGVTINEFVKLDGSFEWESFLVMLEKRLGQFLLTSNSFELEELITELADLSKSSGDKRFYLIGIILKGFHARYILKKEFSIENIDEQEILAYLRTIEYWTSYEYFLAAKITLPLTSEEILEKCKLLFDKEFEITCSNTWILDYIVHLPLQVLGMGNDELANYIIDTYLTKITGLRDPRFMLFDLYALFIRGILLLPSDFSAGEEKCQRIIEIFAKDLGYTFYANRLNIIFNKYKNLYAN